MTPTKLSQITLQQWVEYYNRHGKIIPSGSPTADLVADLVNRWCWFTGQPAPDQEQLPDVLKEQAAADARLKKEQAELNYNNTFLWNDAVWKIAPVLQFPGRMTRAEFEISQDIALIFSDLQDGKQEALYNICAAFMRYEGETYSSYLVDDDNDRVKLMKSLPLDMALCVKAYVEDSICIYLESIKVK